MNLRLKKTKRCRIAGHDPDGRKCRWKLRLRFAPRRFWKRKWSKVEVIRSRKLEKFLQWSSSDIFRECSKKYEIKYRTFGMLSRNDQVIGLSDCIIKLSKNESHDLFWYFGSQALLRWLATCYDFLFRCRAPTIFVEFHPVIQLKVQRTAIFDAIFLNKNSSK